MLAFRPTLMMAMPFILGDLGLKNDGGMLVSTSQLVYMVAKPVAMIVSDRVDALAYLFCSQVATSICFCLIPFARNLTHLKLLFAAVMIAQAPHSPASSRLAANGKTLSTLNATGNVVSCAIPLIVAPNLGEWRRLFFAIATVMSSVAFLQLCSPLRTSSSVSRQTGGSLVDVARSRIIWLIGINYTVLLFLRIAVEGWIGTYLPNDTTFMFWWQCGGVFGSMIAGVISDVVGGGGLTCALFLSACTTLISRGWWHVTFLAGAALYSARLLLTLSTRKFFQPKDHGKADAITNCLGEFGGALAGIPLVKLIDYFDKRNSTPNSAYWSVLVVSAFLLSILHIPLALRERKKTYDV